jgi:autotransporter translocation and assembly factor TamB
MGAWWTSWGKRTAITAASTLGGLILFILFCLFTPPGHHVLVWLIEPLSGGEVAVDGLTGSPNHLQARQVEVRDSAGTWLVAANVQLDWDALSAFGSHIRIDRLTTERIVITRRKVPSRSTSTSTTIIDIGAVALPLVQLDAPVLGRRAVLSASGKLTYVSRHDVAADLSIRRLDGAGRYEVHAAIADDIARGTIAISEDGTGLAGGLIGLPDLGPVTLDVRAAAQGSANAMHFNLTAGLLDVSGSGTINLKTEQADVDFVIVAPALKPSKNLAWNTISARGHLHGPFERPDIDAAVKIAGLAASGVRIAAFDATLKGTGGNATLQGTINGLALPGEKAGVFAARPIAITANADLAAPARPVTFTLAHPLLNASGRTTTRLPMTGTIKLVAPSLIGLATLTGLKIDGSATLTAEFHRTKTDTTVKADGLIAARGNTAPARLLGDAKLAATATMTATGLTLQASLDAAAVKGSVHGTSTVARQSFAGEISISDLSRLTPTLIGTLNLRASLTGPQASGKLTVEGTALAATKGMAKQGVTLSAEASGLPNVKAAHIRASGRFDGSPVSVKTDIAQTAGKAWKVDIADASWRSAHAQGTLIVADAEPQGTVTLHIARLADLTPLIGTALSGSLDARSEFHANTAAVAARIANLATGGAEFDHIDINGTIANPFATPALALDLSVPHFAVEAVSGSAEARVSGLLEALNVSAKAAMTTTNGQSFTVAADAFADAKNKHVTVSRFAGVWRDQTITLASPATLDYADGVKFAATFVERNAMQLTVAGIIPAKGAMNVKANGTADLAVILSGMASIGQNVRGKIAVNVAVTGTPARPNVIGNATLTGGQIQDYTRGVNLTGIEAEASAEGTTIRLSKFTAKAGPGEISGTGTVDLSARGTAVDISFKAANARPIASDLLTANLDSDLKLQGTLAGGLTLSGTLNVRQGNINIPEKFSQEVATLNVRHSRKGPPPPPSPVVTHVMLDLTLVSPGRIFVRGRGLEAEFEGELKIAGTTGSPQVQGALELRRGTLSLAGTELTFTSGTISFNGQALRSRIDPSLNLIAQSEANGITATLKITGTASQPRIEVSSSPSMPQDEVLAQLLFQQSAKSLSAVQLASVAQAAASLGGGGFDPVGVMRRSLGLDRLAVGSNQTSSTSSGSTTIEAGKYVLHNVYIGARQDFSGGTKALVQVTLTKHLKAQAQVTTGPRAAVTTSQTLQDNGDSIGLSYQFEY